MSIIKYLFKSRRALVLILVAPIIFVAAMVAQPVISPSADAAPLLAYDCSAQTEIPEIECDALVALHTDTNGAVWDPAWMTGDPCDWDGIYCTGGYVSNIYLNGEGLEGTLPAQLDDLSHLIQLSIPSNSVGGSIPSTLGNITTLTTLDLSYNAFTGAIPSTLGNLSNLGTFYLQGNLLDGSIPSQLGNLSNVLMFNLSNNILTGTIDPNLANLSSCLLFDLSSNDLSGTIPTWLGSMSTLQWLELDGNELTGSIPSELGNLTYLTTLNLAVNLLDGSIPTSLTGLEYLVTFFMQGNQLTGIIPTNIGDLISLKYLNLAFNQLTGPIPTSIGNISTLQQVQLQNNQLDGSLPTQLGSLTNLTYLILNDNDFGGSIPSSLGNLTAVTSLYLHQNRLTGTIPPELGNMSSLLYLFLQRNALEGEVPFNIVNLTSLLGINIDYNMLVATDPTVNAFLIGLSPVWNQSQTIPPSGVTIGAVDETSVHLSWDSIMYTGNGGYYEVSYALDPGGPYTIHGTTANKLELSYDVDGLKAATTYYFIVRTYTPAHDIQKNDLLSPPSTAVSTATDPGDMALIMNLFRSPAVAPRETANIQWFGRVVLGLTGAPGDDFQFMAWLHVPEDWELRWARQYSFTGDFANVNLVKDYTSLSWIDNASNCPFGGAAEIDYKWVAWQGPAEVLPGFADRLDNQVNLRGGYWVPSAALHDEYRVRVIFGVYFDSDDDSILDTYRCDALGVTPITVPD